MYKLVYTPMYQMVYTPMYHLVATYKIKYIIKYIFILRKRKRKRKKGDIAFYSKSPSSILYLCGYPIFFLFLYGGVYIEIKQQNHTDREQREDAPQGILQLLKIHSNKMLHR